MNGRIVCMWYSQALTMGTASFPVGIFYYALIVLLKTASQGTSRMYVCMYVFIHIHLNVCMYVLSRSVQSQYESY